MTERRQATRRLYRARPEGLAGLREFLDQRRASSPEIGARALPGAPGLVAGFVDRGELLMIGPSLTRRKAGR